MEQTLVNVMAQTVRRHETKTRIERTVIRAVNYETRRLQCSRNGALLRHVKVQAGIDLGTTNAPIVRAGDIALVERDSITQKWLCVGIRSKVRCATGGGPSAEVEIDTSANVSYTATTQKWSQTITPDFLFLPPLESLGQLTLPDQQQDLICGLPRCTDCAPDGYTAGMALVIGTDTEHPGGCWKWGFRSAPCTIYYQSQGAIYSVQPDILTYLGLGDAKVAVREKYAYVAIRGRVPVGGGWEDSLLQTWDLTDPTVPVKVNEQTLPTTAGYQLSQLGIAARDDSLWVYGMDYNGVDSVFDVPHHMKHFDISTRATPALLTEWETELYSSFETFRHFDGTTFVGDTYLVGPRAAGTNLFDRLLVENANDGTVVGTLDGNYLGYGGYSAAAIPVVCDNYVLMPMALHPPFTYGVRCIDLNTPSSPATLWDDPLMNEPAVHLGSNHAYATNAVAVKLYTQLSIDDSGILLDDPTSLDGLSVWGHFVNRNCLISLLEDGLGNAYRIASYTNPIRDAIVTAPRYGHTQSLDGRTSSADIFEGRVYLCSVGIWQTTETTVDAYLTVFTNSA
jgi:hypothetical protein